MMFEIEEEILDPLEPLESASTMTPSDENPFRFPGSHSDSSNSLVIDITEDPIFTPSPTSVQRSLCLNATSTLAIDIVDSEDDLSPTTNQKKICLCASMNPTETQEQGQRSRKSSQSATFPYHTHQITEDYVVSHEIIGIGESGKVMACYNKDTNEKFALKVLRDGPKARREIGLHYLTSAHENVVTIIDIYENTFDNVKCLLMVVEFLEGGDLLSQFENQGSKPYSEKKVGEIIRQIGAAVEYLHDMNIAHRDIKLENILCRILITTRKQGVVMTILKCPAFSVEIFESSIYARILGYCLVLTHYSDASAAEFRDWSIHPSGQSQSRNTVPNDTTLYTRLFIACFKSGHS
ncbi:hypothetical protein Y032_0010g1088 [Ancylostoma ceylanicum]|uniref:non-specific serine/threonine protein kinase n=1 Tax=Ancylostoma ceylanicum TaxID=53326 RepID=A0A016VFX4_9BILA|nr:hypothetical protein Y032_0010g1088 [Ancylostoma ceylanicum]